jgi:hypothetical protein
MVKIDWNGKEVRVYNSMESFRNRVVIAKAVELEEKQDKELLKRYRKHKRKQAKKENRVTKEADIRAMMERVNVKFNESKPILSLREDTNVDDDFYDKCR